MPTRRPVVALAALAVAMAMAALAPAVTAMPFDYEDTTTEAALRSLYVRWLAEYGDHELLAGRRNGVVDERRFDVFKHNVRRALGLRQRDPSYQLAINFFGDLTDEEVERTYTCSDLPAADNFTLGAVGVAPPRPAAAAEAAELPEAVDWRRFRYDHGRLLRPLVTPVKNQGSKCGACWAFAAAAGVEGAHAMHPENRLVSLSAQQLIDCDTSSDGCTGGGELMAVLYVRDSGGLALDTAYPYQARQGPCRKPTGPLATVSGVVLVHPYEEVALRRAVARQPTIARLHVGADFRRYTGGIFRGHCGSGGSWSGTHAHAVVVVGYGSTEQGDDYWIIKNSWGTRWGERGYMRMNRYTNSSGPGICGIQTFPGFPVAPQRHG